MPWHSVFDNGIVKFNTVDAYYFMQQAKLGNIADLWTWILELFNNETVAAIIPVVLYLLCIPVVYYIVKLLFNNNFISGISASLFCIMPGELQNRTALGAADHHCLEIFIFLLAMLMVMVIIRSGKYRLYGITGLLLLTLCYLHTWGGWILLIGITTLWAYINLSVLFYKKSKPIITTLLAGMFIGSPVLLIAIFPYLFTSIVHNITWQINTTVSEEMPLLYSNGMMDLTVWMQNYAMLLYPGLVALGILIYEWYRDFDKGKLLLIVWSVVLLILTLAQRRWTYYSEINIAILAGYCAWWFIDRFTLRKITIIIMACILFIPPVEQGIMMGLSTNGYITNTMHDSLIWLKTQPDGTVLSQWDNGYWIEYYTGKQAYATPGGSNKDKNRIIILDIFSDKTQYYTWDLKPRPSDTFINTNCRYILLDRKTVEGLKLPPDAYISRLWYEQVVNPVYINQDIKIFDMEVN